MLFLSLKWICARTENRNNKCSWHSGSIVPLVVLTFALLLTLTDGSQNEEEDKQQQLKRVSSDDDELHDEEIFRAVVTSLSEWQERKQSKDQLRHHNNSHIRVKRDEEVVCYGELGCFRDEGPFDYLDMLPSPPEEIASRFFLFTRHNRQVPQTFSYFNFTSMYNSHFNASNPTKVIVHGFGSTCSRMWASEMRLALLSVVDCNVICVDWENGAAMPNYVRAAVNTRLVGKQVATLIKWLNDHLGSMTQDYHLIGFSLGAHVAGFAGQELKNLSRITGLDPAGPLFESYDPKVRLDTEDALFVDVIHSNGDSLLMGGLGSWEPMGHVDFYPNGGRVQKGCSNLFLGAVRDFLWSASEGDGRSLCNHRRAYKFFTESVSPRCPFPAFSCESYDKFLAGSCFNWDAQHTGNMGYYADRMPNPKKGLLYLVTREDEPFCANQFKIKVESSPSSAPVTTYGSLETVLIGNDFVNETFLVTQTVKDNMVAGSALQRIIVAHPALTEPVKVQLKYTAYQGWLYSGISRWSMERLILTNAFGQSMSFCSRGLMLPSGVAVTVTLSPGICVNRYVGPPPPPMHGLPPPPGGIIDDGPHHQQGNYIHRPNMTTTTVFDNNNSTSEIDVMMKPPALPDMPSGPGGDQVGPTYHLQTETEWTDWHPVVKPDIDNEHYGETYNKLEPTLVETYPPVDLTHVVDPDGEMVTELPAMLNRSDDSNSTVVPLNGTGSGVGIRICHLTHDDNVTDAENTSRKITCVDTNAQNFTGLNHLVDLKDDFMKASETLLEHNNELRGHGSSSSSSDDKDPATGEPAPTPPNDILGSIPVPPQSFWTAIRHNNSDEPETQIKGTDPDVVLPPHLQYILTQLDSQGFGPRATDIPLASFKPVGQQQKHYFPPRNVRQRRLYPYSRALKPRPVVLTTRRRNRIYDVNEVHFNHGGNGRSQGPPPHRSNGGHPQEEPGNEPRQMPPLHQRHDRMQPLPVALLGPALPSMTGSTGRANSQQMQRAMLAPIIYSEGKLVGRMLPMNIPPVGVGPMLPHGFTNPVSKQPPHMPYHHHSSINKRMGQPEYLSPMPIMALPVVQQDSGGPHHGSYKRKRIPMHHNSHSNNQHMPEPPFNPSRPHPFFAWGQYRHHHIPAGAIPILPEHIIWIENDLGTSTTSPLAYSPHTGHFDHHQPSHHAPAPAVPAVEALQTLNIVNSHPTAAEVFPTAPASSPSFTSPTYAENQPLFSSPDAPVDVKVPSILMEPPVQFSEAEQQTSEKTSTESVSSAEAAASVDTSSSAETTLRPTSPPGSSFELSSQEGTTAPAATAETTTSTDVYQQQQSNEDLTIVTTASPTFDLRSLQL